VINGLGEISYTPGESEGPGTNVLTTVVSDGTVSVTNSFTVVVTEVNQAPVFVAAPGTQTVAEGSTLNITNNATDADVPANTLSYQLLNAPGNAVINGLGEISYTPGESEGPGTNVLTTVVSDGTVSVTNSFTVVVTEVNQAPIATDDSYFLTNSVLTVAARGVLSNDTDADIPTNTLTAVLVSTTTNGVLALNANGSFTYTPANGFNGIDRFTYRANDGFTNSGVATVSITVSNRPFVITSVVVSNGVALITWNSTPGLSYRVQYKTDLNSTNWNNVNPIVTATNITSSVTDNVGTDSQRFYRVQIVETPQPFILSLVVTNGVAVVTWSSVPGKVYGLEYKRELTDTNWTEQTPYITATGYTTTTTNLVGSSSQRFFRVKLIAPSQLSVNPVPVNGVSVSYSAFNAFITWPSVAGKTYFVQYKSQLTDTTWTTIPPNVTAANSSTSITNYVGFNSQRFYRVMAIP
jgi:hypothetical protein